MSEPRITRISRITRIREFGEGEESDQKLKVCGTKRCLSESRIPRITPRGGDPSYEEVLYQYKHFLHMRYIVDTLFFGGYLEI